MTDDSSQPSPQEQIADWVRQVNVRPTDYDNFRGDVDQQEGRLFGGLVLAQSVAAAGRKRLLKGRHSVDGRVHEMLQFIGDHGLLNLESSS